MENFDAAATRFSSAMRNATGERKIRVRLVLCEAFDQLLELFRRHGFGQVPIEARL